MTSYLVSYDLRAPGRNYDDLLKYLRSLPYSAKPLESLWLVETTMTAVELRDSLSRLVDKGDGIMVAKTSGEAAWRNVDGDSDGLKGHF
ncbi:hypothetical protein [Microbacterium sp.]|uniref:hypothetical protein n=1 Tax=Microbacterium sp. TaxID=51671 RepID=UPI003F6E5A0A